MKKILVVDESAKIRNVVVNVIADLGYKAIEAASSLEGLKAAKENSDLEGVIVDTALPGLDAIDMCKKIIQDNPKVNHLPIFAISTEPNYKLRNRYSNMTVVAWIKKPFDLGRIGALLNDFFHGLWDGSERRQDPVRYHISNLDFSKRIFLEGSKESFPCWVNNISRSGIGITYIKEELLEKGSIININWMKKNTSTSMEVAWSKASGNSDAYASSGLRICEENTDIMALFSEDGLINSENIAACHLAQSISSPSKYINIESGNIFESIIHNFPDMIHSVDENGYIISVNTQASNLLGYSIDELIGMHIYDIYADEVIENVKTGFQKLKQTGYISKIDSKLKCKDGSLVPVEIRSFSLYNFNEEFLKTVSIVRDLTQETLMKAQLVQQSKLAAIGELSSGIMHDIRNPLSVIMGHNDTLLKKAIEKKNFDQMENSREKIGIACDRILKLTDHLRSFSRIDDEKMESFSVKELLDSCLMMVEAKINSFGVDIDNKLIDSQLNIYGHENQVEQVFINLISNACDAVKDRDNRVITISAGDVEEPYVNLLVSDSGHGIEEKHLESIFSAFFTTKPKGIGTGLGLSISASIIRDHKGKVDVRSRLGEGTTFTVKLPVRKIVESS